MNWIHLTRLKQVEVSFKNSYFLSSVLSSGKYLIKTFFSISFDLSMATEANLEGLSTSIFSTLRILSMLQEGNSARRACNTIKHLTMFSPFVSYLPFTCWKTSMESESTYNRFVPISFAIFRLVIKASYSASSLIALVPCGLLSTSSTLFPPRVDKLSICRVHFGLELRFISSSMPMYFVMKLARTQAFLVLRGWNWIPYALNYIANFIILLEC